ncbi:hypothetical protein [Streptomyces sp. NPDC048410]|uniref:hypothetical protein n=1 Tax=Streptomyces sp. NPDC048410 TaxID=3365545 RepID=UPI00371D7F65
MSRALHNAAAAVLTALLCTAIANVASAEEAGRDQAGATTAATGYITVAASHATALSISWD